MPKEDCKYWDKCYQRNEQHLQRYSHPPKMEVAAQQPQQPQQRTTNTPAEQKLQKEAPKRKGSPESEKESAEQVGTLATVAAQNCDAGSGGRAEIDTADLRNEALKNISGKNYMEIMQQRIRYSVQAEYDELLRSNEFLRHKFLVEMPPDFYAFWKFASELRAGGSGEEVLQHFAKQFQLQLVGPFEFLAGRFHKAVIREPGDYLRHWRFFYDPPEFQTIFVRRDTGVHYGYWRDNPKDKQGLLIARNDTAKGYEFEFIAGNAFDAFVYFLEKDFVATPFTASVVANAKKALHNYIETNSVSIQKLDVLQKARNRKVVTKTFHRAGIVVPFESKTQLGYRPLMVSDAELKKIIQLFASTPAKGDDDGGERMDGIKTAVMEQLQPIATAASIALDECDFGTSLELGIDLFSSGRLELHMLAQSLLVPVYTLLDRPQFIAISKAHMEKRSKSVHLSIFDLDKK